MVGYTPTSRAFFFRGYTASTGSGWPPCPATPLASQSTHDTRNFDRRTARSFVMPAKRKTRALVNTSAATDASLAVRIPELSPKVRAKALRLFALGHSRNAVARKLGVERAQVHAAVASATAAGTLPAVRARLAARIEALLEDVVAHKEHAPQRLTGYEFGVLYDRYALLRGEATQRIEVTTVSDERQALERELLAFVRGSVTTPPPTLPASTDDKP